MKFLSDDYMEEATRVLNEDETVRSAIGDLSLRLQFDVTEPPHEEPFGYFIHIQDGTARMGRGELADPDARIRHTYATAAGISKGEVNTAAAFMTGKVKVSGNVARLMTAQGALTKFQNAMTGMDVRY